MSHDQMRREREARPTAETVYGRPPDVWTMDEKSVPKTLATRGLAFSNETWAEMKKTAGKIPWAIISQNGSVTLKGPVKSDNEKKSVVAKAIAVAGSADKVTDEVSVRR
jgi:hypothetical protein